MAIKHFINANQRKHGTGASKKWQMRGGRRDRAKARITTGRTPLSVGGRK
jgi:hypothetical protein